MKLRTVAVGFAVALVVVVAAWFFTVWRPKGDEIASVREERDAAVAQQQSLQATLDRLRSIDANRPALEAELRRLGAAVPPQPELASFILAAHEVATRADLAFMSITPALPAANPGAEGTSQIALSISVEGTFFSVLDYLNRLEELERIVVVDSLELSATEEEIESEDEEEAEAAAGPPATTGSAGPSAPSVDGADVVSFTTPAGPVVTDEATLGRPGETSGERSASDPSPGSPDEASASQDGEDLSQEGDGEVEASLLRRERTAAPGRFVLSVSLTARMFTTAAPAGTAPAPGAPTTTVPADGATTTTAAGG